MFEVPSTFRPPSMFGPPSMFTGIPAAATGVESAWCLSFDGVDDKVTTSVAMSSLISASTCTIACWVKPEGSSPSTAYTYQLGFIGDVGGFVSLGRGKPANRGSVDRLWAYNWDGNEDAVGVEYTIGEWCHLAMVHAGGQLYLYKNGVLAGSVASGNTQSLANTLAIGVVHVSYPPFKGRIDDVRIYSRALAPTEVTALYTNTSPPTSGLAFYLPMEEGTGTTTAVKDSTGATIATATLVNGPTWSSSVPPALA